MAAGTPSRDPVGESTLELLDDFPAYAGFIWSRASALVDIRGRVLEMGCGIGTMTRLILGSPLVEAVDAVDLDPSYVSRVAREIGDPRVRALQGSAEDFRPGEGIYDRVVSINVLEHVDDDRAALANFAAVLRPGGEALILVPAHPCLFSTLDEGLSHRRRYAAGGLAAVARAAGLEPVSIVHFNPIGALGWWINGKVLRRPSLPAGQVAVYARLLIAVSSIIDRLNPLPVGISLIARLVKSSGPPLPSDGSHR